MNNDSLLRKDLRIYNKDMETQDNTFLDKALKLEYITIAWNIFEGVAAIFMGISTGSIALFAYGLESSIEVFASSVVVWELKGFKNAREKTALKLIGLAYILVSAYILFEALHGLLSHQHAQRTFTGIILMIFIAFGMGTLGVLKRQGSRVL